MILDFDFPDPRAPNYRAFRISAAGKITGPPTFIEAVNDTTALQQARALFDGNMLELWDCGRFVARIKPADCDHSQQQKAAPAGGYPLIES